MRSTFALPLIAAFALAACSGDDEAMSDEALSADEAGAPVIEDNGLQPQAGEYSAQVELIEIDAPGMTEEAIAQMRAEFEEGAGMPQLYCVTEGMSREDWLAQIAESDCNISRFSANGDTVEGSMQCSADEGLNGRVEFAGTSDEDSSDLRMTDTIETGAGEATVRFRVTTQTTGETCGQAE